MFREGPMREISLVGKRGEETGSGSVRFEIQTLKIFRIFGLHKFIARKYSNHEMDFTVGEIGVGRDRRSKQI